MPLPQYTTGKNDLQQCPSHRATEWLRTQRWLDRVTVGTARSSLQAPQGDDVPEGEGGAHRVCCLETGQITSQTVHDSLAT